MELSGRQRQDGEHASPRLLAADEPPPFEHYNPSGRAPAVLLCDHASRFVPRAMGNLGLGDADLARHIGWDIGIAEVTRALADRLDAPAVLSHFSRLIVDPNRAVGDPTLVPKLSDGVIVPANRDLSEAECGARLETFYRPYHAAIARALDAKTLAHDSFAVISMHSFTPVFQGRARPWQIGILWNRDARLPRPLIAGLRSMGLSVGDNEPYSGRDGHGYSLHTHAEPRRLPHALIEVRQDLIDTRHGAADWAARLGRVLESLLSTPGVSRDAERALGERS